MAAPADPADRWTEQPHVGRLSDRRGRLASEAWITLRHGDGHIFIIYAIFTSVMNNPISVNIGPWSEARAIGILRCIPELEVTVTLEPDSQSDAVVQFAGMESPVAVEFKTRVSGATAHFLANQGQRLDMPLVVVAAETTAKAREILSEAGIGLVDGLGNVRLELPGLLMRITGTGRVARSPGPTRLSGKSGLIAQAMLLDLDASWHVSDLKNVCGVSAGLVHRVLQRLEDEGTVEASGAGPAKTRRLSNPAALLDLWAEEQHDLPSRLPAFMLAPTTDQLVGSLCSGLEAIGVEYALTGAAAADRIAPLLTNVAVTEVWLDSRADVPDLCAHLGAMPVESGANVVFLQERDNGPLAFRVREEGVWSANLFRLYLDTRRDPRRGVEQSAHLRREVIGF